MLCTPMGTAKPRQGNKQCLAGWLYLVISISFGVVGQLLLKFGASSSASGISQFLQWGSIAGLAAYFVAALLYMLALRTVPLSVAFPSVSLSYVIVAYLAHLFWQEPFGSAQIVGLILILSGIRALTWHA